MALAGRARDMCLEKLELQRARRKAAIVPMRTETLAPYSPKNELWRHCYGSAMTEGDDRFAHWVPAPGQIVRIKPAFKGSIEERGFKRASEEGGPKLQLDDKKLYEVVKYVQDQDHRAVYLKEVNIIYVAGKRFVNTRNEVPYPLSIELLQPAEDRG
jgi:hypothetical protein